MGERQRFGKRQRVKYVPARIRRRAMFWLMIAVACAISPLRIAIEADAQFPAPQGIKTIFVDAFEHKADSAQLRDKVIARLHASREVRVVATASDADFIVQGTGETWVKGYVSINPRPSSSVRQAVYGGYLSIAVKSKAGEMLWSYLVTPGRMHWTGVDRDMADHIVRLMLAALRQPDPQAAQSPGAAETQIALSGAGSTFSAPLYQAWIQSFEDRRPELHMTYQSVGSEKGMQLLEDGKVDFAASDVPVSDDQMATMPVKVNQYATVLGGVVPAYNLAEVGRDLRFTPEILAEIYLGKIAKWNDAKLRAVNGGVSLPDQPIVVLHRSDGSGTSFAWTEYLSRTSPEWKSGVGSGMHVSWPTGVGVEGNEGLAAKIAETPGAIGYVELTYAIWHELSYGLVRNSAGRFVQANLESLSAAAQAVSAGDLRAPLVNVPGKDAYPIATFTWILLPAQAHDAKKSAATNDLLHWMLTAGQKECSGLGYVPLPKNLAEKQLGQVRGGD
jgi:phosphate ABC transporter phosphate-binding protein